MGLRPLDVRLDAGDFRFESFDPRLELVDGHGVQVLLCKLSERVARLAREEVLEVHEGQR